MTAPDLDRALAAARSVPHPRTTTAGTPSDGYRTTRRVHGFDPAPLEPGCRPTCLVCDGEKPGHSPTVPTPRKASE